MEKYLRTHTTEIFHPQAYPETRATRLEIGNLVSKVGTIFVSYENRIQGHSTPSAFLPSRERTLGRLRTCIFYSARVTVRSGEKAHLRSRIPNAIIHSTPTPKIHHKQETIGSIHPNLQPLVCTSVPARGAHIEKSESHVPTLPTTHSRISSVQPKLPHAPCADEIQGSIHGGVHTIPAPLTHRLRTPLAHVRM